MLVYYHLYIFSSEICPCLLLFLIELFDFLLLTFKRFLHILDQSFYQLCVINAFSQCAACLPHISFLSFTLDLCRTPVFKVSCKQNMGGRCCFLIRTVFAFSLDCTVYLLTFLLPILCPVFISSRRLFDFSPPLAWWLFIYSFRDYPGDFQHASSLASNVQVRSVALLLFQTLKKR